MPPSAAVSAVEEFLRGAGEVLCVYGPVGSGKLTLCTRAAEACSFKLVPFEAGKAEAGANLTLDACTGGNVAYFWRSSELPSSFKPGGTKLILISRHKSQRLPRLKVPAPTDDEMRRALDALLAGSAMGPAGCDLHGSMMDALRRRRQGAPPLTADAKRSIVLAARNDYRQLLLHAVSPEVAERVPTRAEELKAQFQPKPERAGAPKKGVVDPREIKRLEVQAERAEVKTLNDMLSERDQSMFAAQEIPSVGCRRCRFSARGCKECWERLAASAGDEWHVPDPEQRDRLDEAQQSKKRLPWKAAELAAVDGDRACLLRTYCAPPTPAKAEAETKRRRT